MCSALNYFPAPIDKIPQVIYNINTTLSRAAEETGPVKPGNLTVIRQGAKSCGLSGR